MDDMLPLHVHNGKLKDKSAWIFRRVKTEPVTLLAGISEEEKLRLLHCVVIGGDPTGANEILSSFDVGLRQYATNHLTKSGVCLVRGVVKEVLPNTILLSGRTNVLYGLLVWSTGVGPSRFVKTLGLPKAPSGRIGIEEWLRVPSVEDVFALGDCASFLEQTGKQALPALAQDAKRLSHAGFVSWLIWHLCIPDSCSAGGTGSMSP
ncbi:hypothetical protein QJS10_CPB19g00735 [Acorus calamus]|uniref:FAD/NAD(P)-binding domain-containing protein n=1 Tax=Acorus calamus TaxID=4465 RepID=A0AAV9CK55_ACOCL|nr:hypothetical protein QJS10_CPB19g00733 [Acorus calamus]KAK1288474.1 hypothetical protein QJS10_CPB19g00735 [Acorus calamus]